MIDPDVAEASLTGRDPRLDGLVYVGVVTTGVYCRPSCPAVMPKRENMRLFATAADARDGGYRACKRCRPEALPGSAQWDVRADLAQRAMRLIADGLVDHEGVAGLARRLGYSERQLHRQLVAEVGAGPQALARAHRARAARAMLESTDMPVADIAFAAGFASIRQFNATFREQFGTTPTAVRAAARHGDLARHTIPRGEAPLRGCGDLPDHRAPSTAAGLGHRLERRPKPVVQAPFSTPVFNSGS